MFILTPLRRLVKSLYEGMQSPVRRIPFAALGNKKHKLGPFVLKRNSITEISKKYWACEVNTEVVFIKHFVNLIYLWQ